MTCAAAAGPERAACSRRGYLVQLAVVGLINVPVMMYGAVLGWVSGASGAGAGEWGAGGGEARLVLEAALTLAAGAAGVPLAAAALRHGRRNTLLATSAGFLVCWLLKLCGGWWVEAGRAVAGLAGAAAWTLAPLLAKEMCSESVRGAAGGACVAAHNLGMLLMYLAAEWRLSARTVLWCGAGVAGAQSALCLLVPESPAFLAARGRRHEAGAALARLRGLPDPPLLELKALPWDQPPERHLQQLRDMWGEAGRRRALVTALVCVAGQELCGVLVVLQFAERALQLAGEGHASALAVGLGGAQLGGALVSLYLVERLGRRPLVVWSAGGTAVCLAAAAACVWGGAGGAGAALAAAVLADSAGAQAAPYAMLADMFPMEGAAAAALAGSASSHAAAALAALALPALAASAGLAAALAAAALVTSLYCLWAACVLPETRSLTPELIYQHFARHTDKQDVCCDNKHCSKV